MMVEFFNCMVSSIQLLRLRGSMSTFPNICASIQNLTKRKFSYMHLAQMKYVFSEAVLITKVVLRDGATCCMKPELQVALRVKASGEEERRKGETGYSALRRIFRDKLVDFANKHPQSQSGWQIKKDGGARLRKSWEAEMEALLSTQTTLRQRMDELACRLRKMDGEREGLEQQLQVVSMNVDVLGGWVRENEGRRKGKGSVDVDEVFESADVLSRQLLECTAVDLAIEVLVCVMLLLDTVSVDGGVNRKKVMAVSFVVMKSVGVEGVMVDVWWGIVKRERLGEYEWGGCVKLLKMTKKIGLKVQAVMSFHQCRDNVGDSITKLLPKWVLEEMDQDPDLTYIDQWGRRNYEYVSLSCDTLPVLKDSTPVQCYVDFMRTFRDRFEPFLGFTIVHQSQSGWQIKKDGGSGLRKSREAEIEALFSIQTSLRQRADELARGLREMDVGREWLEQQLQVGSMNVDVLEGLVRENEVREKGKGSVDMDEVFELTDALSRQLLECIAADLAFKDMIYALDKSM